MDELDTPDLNDHDEENMFLCDVCGDDHELLFLDGYLRETFRGRGHGHGPVPKTAEVLSEVLVGT